MPLHVVESLFLSFAAAKHHVTHQLIYLLVKQVVEKT